MNLESLLLPFPKDDIEWRLQSCGESNSKIWAMCLAYVTNRAIQERLDQVCGAENWKNQYKNAPDGGILCGISIFVEARQEWVTKWDGAENTAVEAVKGGLSGAMKRAAVQWGIGRYLYNLDANFAQVHEGGKFKGSTKDKKYFKWSPPELPEWASGPPVSLLPSIRCIHQALQNEDCLLMRETWDELTRDEQSKIFLEFKTKQKTAIKELLHKSATEDKK